MLQAKGRACWKALEWARALCIHWKTWKKASVKTVFGEKVPKKLERLAGE